MNELTVVGPLLRRNRLTMFETRVLDIQRGRLTVRTLRQLRVQCVGPCVPQTAARRNKAQCSTPLTFAPPLLYLRQWRLC